MMSGRARLAMEPGRMELDFFMAEHAVILDLIEEQLAAIRADALPGDLHQRLAHLDPLLRSHLAKEDTKLYPYLRTCGRPNAARLAAHFAEEMGDLATHWRDHVALWPIDAIAADRAGYADAATPLLEALRARTLREERHLYPLCCERPFAASYEGALDQPRAIGE
jgi:hypothetical protein